MNIQEIEQQLRSTGTAEHWKKIGVRNHHGIAVPLFSLHSQNSCGIGEYPDLIPMIGWCKENGFDVIQLLPLNDTGNDTSPYSALSAFALNPIHLGLSQLPLVAIDAVLQQEVEEVQYRTAGQQLRIDYPDVQTLKEKFLRNYFRRHGLELMKESSYNAFKEQNASWLIDYTIFKSIKNLYGWQSWELWQPSFKDPSLTFLQEPPQEIALEATYHSFVQYLCFHQLRQVKQHADQEGVFLKGDIPILINRESADVWHNRQLFKLQMSAGAPPDLYASEGQKWGFPLYDWDAMAANNYQWWINRLNVCSQFYHLYRIDHIVGFFRIWAIPLSRPPKEGHFIPEDPSAWIPHGEEIMRMMLSNCTMLPIGEDLGVVPPEVRVCLRNLGICGTKVMRWERRWNGDGGFINPKEYSPESMSTVSTHDSETLQQWWENNPEEARLYASTAGWTYTPKLGWEQHLELLRACHHSGSLFHINLLQEYLALVPGMIWPDPDDERINRPGIISDKNWSYLFRPSVEEIVTNSLIKNTIQKIVEA